MPLYELRKCEVFRSFLLHALRYWTEILHIWICFNVIQITLKCCLSASVWLSVRPSIFYTCLLYALTIELKILNLTLVSLMRFFRIVLYKNSHLKCSWRAYYAPFAVLKYIWIKLWMDNQIFSTQKLSFGFIFCINKTDFR